MPATPPLDSTEELREYINDWVRNDATPSFQALRMNTILISLADFIDDVIIGAGGEPTIAAGTTAQYWRGDKTWQTLNKAAVILGNVQNVDQTVATNLTSGSIPAGRYGALTIPISAINATGTADSTTVLFGDGTWGAVNVTDGDKGDITVLGTSWTINDDAITINHLPEIPANRLIGRISGGVGDMEILTGSQATTLLDVFSSTIAGIVPFSGGGTVNFLRADGTWADPGGGGSTVSDADYGDITVSSGGSTWTIDALAVTNGKINDVAFSKVTGTISAAQVAGTTTNGYVATLVAGVPTWQPSAGGGALIDGDYGDIVLTSSGTVWTIEALAVTLPKMQAISTASILGRATAGSGIIEVLTGTQATELLNVFTTTLKGLVPLSGGGTTNFLRADGTWAVPPGGSSFTTEDAQDAVGAMINATLSYVDATPLLTINLGNANTWTADQSVPDDAYDATTWNGNMEVPTKNALRDKIETLAAASGLQGVLTVSNEATKQVALGGDYNLSQNRNNDYVSNGSKPYQLEVIYDKATFDITGEASGAFAVTAYSDDAGGNSIHSRKARGTQASPTSAIANDRILSLGAKGYVSATSEFGNSSIAILATATETYTATAQGAYVSIETMTTGTTTRAESIRFNADATHTVQIASLAGSGSGYVAVDNDGKLSWGSGGGAGSLQATTDIGATNDNNVIFEDYAYLALKGDASYNQPITFGSALFTDLAGIILPGSNAGMVMQGFSNGAGKPGYRMLGHIGATTTTVPAFVIEGLKSDGGTDRVPVATTEQLFGVYNGMYDGIGTERFIMNGDGMIEGGSFVFNNYSDNFISSNASIGYHSNGYVYLQGGTNGAFVAGDNARNQSVLVSALNDNIQFRTNAATLHMTLSSAGALGFGTTPGYGTSGQVLTSAGTGGPPTWTTISVTPTLQNVLDNGSTLTSTETIVIDGNILNFTANNASQALNINNSGSGNAVYCISTINAIIGLSTGSGAGVMANSTSGTGLIAYSTSGVPASMYTNPSSTNTVIPILRLERQTSGTPANGLGGSIEYQTQTSTNAIRLIGSISSSLTTVTDASRTSKMDFRVVNSATTTLALTIDGDGRLVLPQYSTLATYVDEAAAVTGGLAQNTIYKTATGELRIKL